MIAVGLGYFAFLVYTKWPQLKEEETPPVKESLKNIKYLPKKTLTLLKKAFERFKKINFKQILQSFKKINFSKIFNFLKKTLKKLIKLIRKVFQYLKKQLKKLIILIKKIRWPFKKKKVEPFFEQKVIGEDKEEIKKEEKPKISFKLKLPKIKKDKNFLGKIKAKIKKSIRRLKLRAGLIFLKELKNKVKVRFVSEEDKKIKKQLKETKEIVVSPESYLGELLKKTASKPQEPETEKERSLQEAINEWVSSEIPDEVKKAKREEKKKEKEVKAEEPKEEPKREIRQEAKEPEISEKTLKKVESRLIQEILDDPKNIEAYKKLGKVYFNQDKFEYAKECFEAAIKLGSGDKKIKDLLKETQNRT